MNYPRQFLLGIVTPTRPVTPQQTGFFSPWVLLLECQRSWSTRTRKEVNLPCCTMGGKLNYLFLCDTLAVSISVQYRTFISHMGFAGSPFHVVRLHNMCWISMENWRWTWDICIQNGRQASLLQFLWSWDTLCPLRSFQRQENCEITWRSP